jgi:hypothetical protein
MRRSSLPRPLVLLLALLAIASSLALAACSGAALGPATRTSADGSRDVLTTQEGVPAPEMPFATAGPAGEYGGTTAEAAPYDAAPTAGPMIVRTGTLDLQVAGVDKAVADATRIVTAAGGYVAGSESSFDGDQPIAMLTLRIPAAAWDATLAELRGISIKVLGEKTSSSEVTSQVVDMDARIVNLRATEAALLQIMEKATRVSDILEVQGQLTSVRGEIEQLQASRKNLADQAAQGTLAVTFGLAPAPVTTVTNAWDPGTVVAEAAAALVGMGQGVASAAIWLAIVGLPILLAGLVILVPLLLIVRALARRGRTSAPTAGPPAETGAAA